MPYQQWAWIVALAVACGDAALRPGSFEGLDPEVAALVEAAERRVAEQPRDAAAALELALVLDAHELDEAAEPAWERVLTLAPEDARAHYHLARVRERRGDVEGALAALARTLALAPDYAPAHARLGRLQLDLGRLAEADAALERALALDPGSPAALLARARVELLRGRADHARALLVPLRARLPAEPYVNGLLARAAAMQGDPEGAEQYLAAEARAGAPSARDPWQAEVQRRAVGLKARLDRAKARLESGDADGAWRELAPLEARTDELAVLDAQCQVLAALGRPAEVLARIERAPAELRASALLAVKRVLALRALGEDAEALAAIAAEVRRNPAHPQLHALHGEILFDLGRFDEAGAALAEARAREDGSLGTLLLLARARGAAGDLEAGLRVFQEAAGLYPEAPKPWAYQSELLALDGRFDEARASLGEAERRGLEPELVALVAARIEELGADGGSERAWR